MNINSLEGSTIRKTVCIVAMFFLSVLFINPIELMAQQDDDRRDFGELLRSMGSDLQESFYIDEVGLRLMRQATPLKEFLDAETYVLGPHDVLSIKTSGTNPILARGLTVTPEGFLVLPIVGKVSVRDLTIDEARDKLELLFLEQFREIDIELSLDSPRPFFVNIFGDAPNPGSYMLPAGSRLDVALYLGLTGDRNLAETGGVQFDERQVLNREFSLRNIEIKHKDGSTTHGDIVHYIRTGDHQSNPHIRDGDRIILQKRGEYAPRISISGAISTPIELEYRQGDTISKLIDMAGGFVTESDSSFVYLYERNQGRTTVNRSEFDETILDRNDRVVVPFSEDADRFESAWVHGQVQIPGSFPIRSGETTVAELMDVTGGANDKALMHGAYIIRHQQANRDVPSPYTFSPTELMRTSDQVLQGMEYLEMEANLNSANHIHIDLSDQDQLEQIVLHDGDRLFVPKDENSIMLFGQVNNPGHYELTPGLSAEEYIQRAGGYTIAADMSRVFVIKAGSRTWKKPGETSLRSGDILFVDRTPYEELNALRNYEIQLKNLRRQNVQIVLTAISTVTAILTTYVAIRRL